MAVALPPFPEFDVQPKDTASIRFDEYLGKLDLLFAAMEITNAPRKRAMLLHYAGDKVQQQDTTNAIPTAAPENDNRDYYTRTVDALKNNFEPYKMTDRYVGMFRLEEQRADEDINSFHARLQIMAKKCDFHDKSLEVKRQIIKGTSNPRLRRKAYESNLTLEQLLRTGSPKQGGTCAAEHTLQSTPEAGAVSRPTSRPISRSTSRSISTSRPTSRSRSHELQARPEEVS